MLLNRGIRPPIAGSSTAHLSWLLGFFQLARKAFEMRHTLLMIQPFVLIRAQYGVGRYKRTSQIDLATKLRIPPTVGYSDVSLLHRVVHSDLRKHRALGSGKLGPIAVNEALFLSIYGMQE